MNKLISLLILYFFVSNLVGQVGGQKASIMVIPSDNLMKRLGCLQYKEIQGLDYPIRNFQKAFIDHADLKFVISGIKEAFAERGYPLEDLEQTLKSIQNEQSLDNVESFDFDPRTLALKSARPDIILDLTYEMRNNGMTKQLVFNIEVIDAYTLKGISSSTSPGIETTSNNVPALMKEQLELNINNLQDLINLHFQDIAKNGREISLRIVSENQAISDFRRDRLCGNLPLASWIPQWLKENSINGYGKRTLNSAKEIKFNHIRIPLKDKGGYAMSASEWSAHLMDAFFEECSEDHFIVDYSSGLGEAFLIITK